MQIRPVTPQYNNKYPIKPEVSFGLNCQKLQGLTYEKYKDLSFWDKLKFKMLSPMGIKRDARASYYAARSAQSYLDSHYGRDNYTVMIVGRSMATIGETMRLLGRDVRFLPMSDLSNGMPKEIENVGVYKKYLDSISLTKEVIENNPERHFLLVDYVSSGESLKNAHRFLSRPDLLGHPDRLRPIPSQMLLGYNSFMASCLELLFLTSNLKKYSPIRSLILTELDKTFERLQPNPNRKDKRNLFLFNIMRKIEHYRKKTGK